MKLKLAWLLLLAGCDSLFNLDHVNVPPIDADRDAIASDTTPDVLAGTTVDEVDAGDSHTCVRAGAAVRCFGFNGNGRLGLANVMTIGDNEYPRTVPFVNVGAEVAHVSAGETHTCVVTTAHNVRCWGSVLDGRLGYGLSTGDIGDDEAPATRGDVDVGIAVDTVSAGGQHTCALGGGAVRCWGSGTGGRLGYGNLATIGNDESPASAGDVSIGETVVQISAGPGHTCAVTDQQNVFCWGLGGAGRLGYGNTSAIGDSETPAAVGPVPAGGSVTQVVTGNFHTCVLFTDGSVRCWGTNQSGQLGIGTAGTYGDNEIASTAPLVNVGGPVEQLAAGDAHTCALLQSVGTVRCWGDNTYGQLGYSNTVRIGDDEAPAAAGDVLLGGVATAISAAGSHTCARLTTGTVRCWGRGESGRLGYGNESNVGDNEVPSQVGDVPVL